MGWESVAKGISNYFGWESELSSVIGNLTESNRSRKTTAFACNCPALSINILIDIVNNFCFLCVGLRIGWLIPSSFASSFLFFRLHQCHLLPLKYKISTIHCIIKILTTQVFNTARMEIKCTNISMINTSVWCFY